MLLVLAAPPVLTKALRREVPPIVREEVAPLVARVNALEGRSSGEARAAQVFSITERDSGLARSSGRPDSVGHTPTRKVYGE